MDTMQIRLGTLIETDNDRGLCKIQYDDGTQSQYPIQLVQPYAGRGWGMFVGHELNMPLVMGIQQGKIPHILNYLPNQLWYEDFIADMRNGNADKMFGFMGEVGKELSQEQQEYLQIDEETLENRELKYYPLIDPGDILFKSHGMASLLLDHLGNVMIEDRYDNRLHFLGGTHDREGTIRQESRHWEVQNEAGYLIMGMVKRAQLLKESNGYIQNLVYLGEDLISTGIKQVEEKDPNDPALPEDILTEFNLGIFEKADNSLGVQVEGVTGEVHSAEDLQILDKKYHDLIKKNQLVEINIGTITDDTSGKVITTHEKGAEPTTDNFLESKYGAKVFPDDPRHTNAFIHSFTPSDAHGLYLQGPNYKNSQKEVKKMASRGKSEAHTPFVKNKKIVFRVKTRAGSTINITEDGSITMYVAGDQDINVIGNIRQNVEGSVIQTVANDVDQTVEGRVFQTVKGYDKEGDVKRGADYCAITQYVEKGTISQIVKEGNISQSIEKGDVYTSIHDGDQYSYINGHSVEHIVGNFYREVEGTVYETLGALQRKIKGDYDLYVDGSINMKSKSQAIDTGDMDINSGGDMSISAGKSFDIMSKINMDFKTEGMLNIDGKQAFINSQTAKPKGAQEVEEVEIPLTDSQWPNHKSWTNKPEANKL